MHPATRLAARAALVLGSLALAQGLAGCGTDRGARIRYTHPSPLSRWGTRVRVEPLDNDGTGFTHQIEQAVRQSGAFQLVVDGAQMAVGGEVVSSRAEPEQVGSRPHTCARQVPETRTRQVPVMVSVNPVRMEMRTEQYTEMVPQPYACTELVRSVDARFHVHVRVNARTRPIQMVLDRNIELADTQETTGLSGSDHEDHPPAPVDGAGLLATLQQRAVQQFAQAALPTASVIEVDFADCGDARCENGIQLVRGGALPQAEAQFSAVAESLSRATDPSARRKYAAALFNRGVVRGYSDQLDAGIDDLRLAIATDARDASWARHLSDLQELQGEQEASRFRGETTTGVGHAPAAPATTGHGRGGRR